MEELSDHQILVEIYNEQKKMKEQLKQIPEMQEQLKAIPEIQEKVKVIPEIQEKVKVIPEIQEKVKVIPEIQEQLNEIPKIKEELRRISGSVARIEVEHGEKLAMLFDAFKVNSERIEKNEKKVDYLERKIESQNDQIYCLKSRFEKK